MTGIRAAAALLLALVCAVSLLDAKSETADRIRQGSPLLTMLSLRHEGQPAVTPPALYLLVYGTNSGSLEMLRIPPDTPVFEHGPGGERENLRTLADAYAAEGGADPSENAMIESALTMLQGDPAWPQYPGPGPEPTRPAPLDFRLPLSVGADARPGFPAEMKRAVAARLKDRLFWPRFTAAAPGMKRRGLYDRVLLAREFRRVRPQKIRVSQLSDPNLSSRLLARIFSRANGAAQPHAPFDIEVLNASDTAGLALRATRILRLRGFDVKHFGNAAAPENASRFLDRTGDAEGAEAVADALGCGDADVLSSLEAGPQASVAVILGRDYGNCRELASGSQAGGESKE